LGFKYGYVDEFDDEEADVMFELDDEDDDE
jgi:hypothetical protein